jgi:hypothetical protein
MKRAIICALALAFALATLAVTASAQATPAFQLGFKALADQIPEVVGVPLEDEHFNLSNGNSEQHTTKGLMVWRKADNWTAFTDGYRTWINGPNGVQSRLNTDRFDWEKDTVVSAPAPSAPAPSSPSPAPQTFQGHGKSVSPKFSLQQGLSVFRVTHNGKANFAIWLMDDQGSRIDLLVNTIGSYDARKAEGITKAGTYIMDVEADGNWTVTVEQPRPSDAPGLPQTFTGTGRTVSPFFSLPSGLITVDMSHNGKANFAIWLMDKDGQQEDLLVNTIGQFQGSKALGVGQLLGPSTGVHLLDIEADGAWTVSIH